MLAYVSLWSADLLALGDAVDRVAGVADAFHVDVFDGHNVAELLFGPDLVAALRKKTPLPIDVHLNVSDPDYWAARFASAGADMITVQSEASANIGATLALVRSLGVSASVGLEVHEPTARAEALFDQVERVLVMGTPIGVKGADLDPSTPGRVSSLVRARHQHFGPGRAKDRSGRGHPASYRRELGSRRGRWSCTWFTGFRPPRPGGHHRMAPFFSAGRTTMKAAVVTGPGCCEVLEVADPAPGAGQAVVEVDLCGVCGTDLHVVDGEHASVRYPVVPGHEFSGRVVATGDGVATSLLGSMVVVDPMVYCGRCQQCRAGWTNLCAAGGGLGTTADGAFAQYVAVQATQCEPVPEGLPAAWAPLTEPLSCCLHSLDRIGPVVGADALIFGAGPAGLLLTRLMALGGARVDVVERRPERRHAAEDFGAHRSASEVGELEHDGGWQVVVDATGSPSAIEQGLSLVRRAGTFAIFGVSSADARVSLSPYEVFSRELTIIGSNSVRHTLGALLPFSPLATSQSAGSSVLLSRSTTSAPLSARPGVAMP